MISLCTRETSKEIKWGNQMKQLFFEQRWIGTGRTALFLISVCASTWKTGWITVPARTHGGMEVVRRGKLLWFLRRLDAREHNESVGPINQMFLCVVFCNCVNHWWGLTATMPIFISMLPPIAAIVHPDWKGKRGRKMKSFILLPIPSSILCVPFSSSPFVVHFGS